MHAHQLGGARRVEATLGANLLVLVEREQLASRLGGDVEGVEIGEVQATARTSRLRELSCWRSFLSG